MSGSTLASLWGRTISHHICRNLSIKTTGAIFWCSPASYKFWICTAAAEDGSCFMSSYRGTRCSSSVSTQRSESKFCKQNRNRLPLLYGQFSISPRVSLSRPLVMVHTFGICSGMSSGLIWYEEECGGGFKFAHLIPLLLDYLWLWPKGSRVGWKRIRRT